MTEIPALWSMRNTSMVDILAFSIFVHSRNTYIAVETQGCGNIMVGNHDLEEKDAGF